MINFIAGMIFGVMIMLIASIIIDIISSKKHIITLVDKAPKDNRKQSRAMQFSNELEQYIKEDNGMIKLTIWKD